MKICGFSYLIILKRIEKLLKEYNNIPQEEWGDYYNSLGYVTSIYNLPYTNKPKEMEDELKLRSNQELKQIYNDLLKVKVKK